MIRPRTKPRTIVIDLDGTLVNMADEVCLVIWNHLGVRVSPSDIVEYDVPNSLWRLPVIKEVFKTRDSLSYSLDTHVWLNAESVARARPYFDWHKAVHKAMTAGVEVIMLTARPAMPHIVRATEKWCEYWKYEDCELLFSATYDKGKPQALIEILLRGGTTPLLFIDDNSQVCHEIAALCEQWHRDELLEVVMPYRQWTLNDVGGPIAVVDGNWLNWDH